MPPPKKPASRYQWNAKASRYVDRRDGRFVPRAKIRAAIDRAIRAENKRMVTLAEQMRSREIGVNEWQTGMRRNIKNVHLYSAAAARGGWAQMTPADYGRVGGQVADQFRYLDKFVGQVDKGLKLDGRFISRVELYSEASRTTYEATLTREMEEHNGMTEEKNILHPADHCQECLGLADLGWVPIGSTPPIGKRQCGNRCKCTKAFR